MKKIGLVLASILVLEVQVWAQDERMIHQFILPRGEEKEQALTRDYHWQVQTPFYQLDLNGDGKEESLLYAKRDQENWLEIYGEGKQKIFSFKLPAIGSDALLYKLRLASLSEKSRVLMLYFYQGKIESLGLISQARVYFLAFDKDDLSKIYPQVGPVFWVENESEFFSYSQRFYNVTLAALDESEKFIVVEFSKIKRAYQYKPGGHWKVFD